MKLILLLLLNISCVFANDNFNSPTTFSNLVDRISASDKQQVPHFDLKLNAAQSGDLISQILLSDKLYKIEKLKPVILDLFIEIYDENGFNIKPENKFLIYSIYSDLANEYISGELIKPEPIKGFAMLVKMANDKDEIAMLDLSILIYKSSIFPENELLMHAWDPIRKNKNTNITLDELITSYNDFYNYSENDITAPVEPEDHLFKACENQFKKDTDILDIYNQKQKQILANNVLDQSALKNIYAQISPSTKVSFSFRNIIEQAVFSLLVDIKGSTDNIQYFIKFPKKEAIASLDMVVNNVPVDLVYQQYLQKLNWDISCYENWLKFSYKKHKSPKGLTRIFTNFIIERKVLDNNTAHIVWNNEVSYKGGYKDGKFDGGGKFTYFMNDKPVRTVEGNFKNGNMHGQGKDYYIDGSYSYVGEYKNGLFHGQGHLVDNFEQFEKNGMFINGVYASNQPRKKYFVRDSNIQESTNYPIDFELISKNKSELNNYILYEGPFIEDEPSGKGHCYLKEMNYGCTFYKGFLIGIDGFSLLPSNVTVK